MSAGKDGIGTDEAAVTDGMTEGHDEQTEMMSFKFFNHVELEDLDQSATITELEAPWWPSMLNCVRGQKKDVQCPKISRCSVFLSLSLSSFPLVNYL